MLPESAGPKVQYFTATSLDGFIADADNSLDWLFEVPHSAMSRATTGPGTSSSARSGPLVMGATTYEWVLGHHPEMLEGPEKWREFYDDRPAWVFTHRELPRIPGVDLTFVRGDVRPVYDAMVAARPGQNIWVVGGGDLVGQFDDAGPARRDLARADPGDARRRGAAAAAADHLGAAAVPRRVEQSGQRVQRGARRQRGGRRSVEVLGAPSR